MISDREVGETSMSGSQTKAAWVKAVQGQNGLVLGLDLGYQDR